jgi:hypothetical protein
MGAHALLIGISHFDDPKLAALNSPKEDVQAFAQVLADPQRGCFDSVEVSIDNDLLTLRDQLSTLMDGRSADDMVLLYYSGHGIVAKGQRLYLATGQSSFDKPQARSLSTNEIRDLMEQSRASRLVVILDCCHSGVFAEGAKGGEAPVMTDSTFGEIDGAEGQYILTATDALQYAYDGTGALRESKSGPLLSRFTRWLVDGIGKGEASPFDENITLDALYQYLCRRARAEQAGMNPQRFVKRGSGEIVIAKNPAGKQLELPQNLLAQLDSPQWQMRKQAIVELSALAKQKPMMPLVKKAILDRISDERDVDVREGMVNLLQRLGVTRVEDLPSPPPSGEDAETQRQATRETKKPKSDSQPAFPSALSFARADDWRAKLVAKGMVNVLQRFGVIRIADPPSPPPAEDDMRAMRQTPRETKQPRFTPKSKNEPEPAAPPAMFLPHLNDWQTKVLVKSGVQTGALMAANAAPLSFELQRRANGLRTATYFRRAAIGFSIFFGLGAIGSAHNTQDSDNIAVVLVLLFVFGIVGLVNRRKLRIDPQFSGDPDMKRLEEGVPLIGSRWGWGWSLAKREYEANIFHRGCWWMVIGAVLSIFGVAVQS